MALAGGLLLSFGCLVGSCPAGGPCPARAEAARAHLVHLHRAVDLFRLEQGRLPGKLGDLAGTAIDAWGRDFLYVVDGDRYRIGSLGEDGTPGVDDLWSLAP